MIPNTVLGAVYLSIIDMILLLLLLLVIGGLLKLFPLINKIEQYKRKK
ncbi:MAG: hypothetical protein ACPLW7_02760 [Minisyncoccia bacterium]